MEHLIYTALPPQDPNAKAIPYSRLIELWPGEGADPFYCTLQVVDISQPPVPFEALSYVWGREKSDDVLLCGDNQGGILGQLEMTRNLEQALRGLRLPQARRTLWIDAICIRQDDTAERARQVSYMRSVYQHASRVIIWLGLKDTSVRRAFSLAAHLAVATVTESEKARQNVRSPQQAQEAQMQLQASLLQFMRDRPEDANALDAFFRREYFERVWCIQEVAAGQNCMAKCEDLEIDFNLLLLNVPLIVAYRGLTPDKSGLRMWLSMAMMKAEGEARRQLAPAGSMGPILQVLLMVRNFKATNPVDRIFALLGCTDEGLEPILGTMNTFNGNKNNRRLALAQRGLIWLAKKVNSMGPEMQFGRPPALRPNYDKSVKDVYRDFTRYCIRRSPRVLDVLSHVQHDSEPIPPRERDEFPTWVPKFYEPRIASSFVLGVSMAGIPPQGHYRYFAELHDNPLVQSSIVEPDVLQAEGFRVDVVEAVSEIITPGADEKISPQIIWNQLFSMPLFPRPTTQYISGRESLDVTFFMTLLAGGVMNAVDLGVEGAPTSRNEALEYITRQAKGDIHEWLQKEPNVDPHAYPDLVRDSQGATRTNGRARFETCSLAVSLNRRLYRTRSGVLGLGPKVMKTGDVAVVLFGGKCPYILRQSGSEWLFLGEAYLRDDNVMQGGAVTEVRSGRRKGQVETFRMR